MKNLRLPLILLIVLSLTNYNAEAQYTATDLFNDLQNELNTKSAAYGLPGTSFSVTLRDGSSYTGIYGDKCNNQSIVDTLQWHWGSISKATTATIIMQMRDQGLLSLSDSLGTYFDPSPYTNFIDATNNTIGDLLQHTSDIADPWVPGNPGSPFYEFVKNNPDSILDQTSGFSYINTTSPNPNSDHEYKPYINYALLSMVIESISGNTLKQEYQSRIFGPLGMNKSTLVDSVYDLNNMNGLFANGNERCSQSHTAYLTRGGGGALLSSIEDITKFMNRLHGDSLLNPATMSEMRTTIDANITGPLPCGGNVNVEYGLGVLNPILVFAPGDTMKLYGHSGSGRSTGSVFHNIDSGWTVAVVSNDYGTNGTPSPNQLTNLLVFDILCLLHNNPVDYPPAAQAPIADFSFVNTGTTVDFTDLSINNPTSWFWDFGDGNTDSLQNPNHVFQNMDSFTVTLIASNSAGSDTITKTVDVTAIRDVIELGAKIYPNPFENSVNFDFRNFNGIPDEIIIYNVQGLEVGRVKNDKFIDKITWDASEQKPGMLFYKVLVNSKVYQGKLIKN